MYYKLCGGFVGLFVLFLSGCSTVESRIQSNPQVYGSLSPAVRRWFARAGSGKVCRKPLFTWPGAVPIGFVPGFGQAKRSKLGPTPPCAASLCPIIITIRAPMDSAIFGEAFGGTITFSIPLALILTRSIRILTLFPMRYPTRLSFSNQVVAQDGSICAIEKGLAFADISLT